MTEANKLEIPVVGTGDTNVDPDELDYIIPANDDAIRAIRLLCTLVAEAAIEGAQRARDPRGQPSPRSSSRRDARGRRRATGASDELVAALAGGGALTFEPDTDEDDLLPGDRSPVPRRPSPRRPRRQPKRPPRRSPPSSRAKPPRRRRPTTPADPAAAGPRSPPRPTDTRGRPTRPRTTGTGAHPPWRTSRRSWSRSCASGPVPGSWIARRPSSEADGDLDKATSILRERGLAAAAKKSGREAREGLISSYIHTGGRVGVLIEVNCETDFVARTDEFQKLVKDLAVQVAGLAPLYVDRESIPAGRARSEEGRAARRRVRPEEAREHPRADRRGPAREVVSRRSACSTSRSATRSAPSRELITDRIATIGENIRVRRFTRYALGEEL